MKNITEKDIENKLKIDAKLFAPFSWRKAMKIVREYLTDIPKTKNGRDFIGYVIWNETGWPTFWEGDAEAHFRKQLQEYAAQLAARNGAKGE